MADCQGIGGQGCGSGTGISGRPRAGASPGCRIGSRCRYQGSLYIPVGLTGGTTTDLSHISPGQPVVLIGAQGALADEELVSEELTCENGCCGTYRSVGSAEPAHSVPVAGALVEGSSETQADVNRELSGLMQGLAAAPKEGLHETPVYVALKLSDYRSMLSEAREKRGLEEQNNAMRAEMLVQREDLEKSATLTGKLSEALQCTICIETFSSPHTLSCGHTFCKECLVQWLAVSMMCPTCRAPVDQRPALSYTIQEMVSLVDARDAGEPAPPPSSSASSSLAAALMAVNGDRSSTPQANVFDRIFGSQHADRDQHLQQDESAPYDAGGRCSICREYPLLNGRCLNCLQSSHAELAEQLQSFQSYFDPSPDSSSQRRGNDSSMRIDDLFLNLSLVDEDESFENESPSASNVGSDTGAATERPPRMLRPASPSESSFALNEIFNMVPQPRIPAYRLAARSAVRADNDAATSSGHREAGLSRQARSSLSSSSRIPYSRSVFASSASSEETGAAAARPRAYQGSSGSTASGTSASVQARNPIRISAIMSQGQEQSHARGAASGLDSTALLERQTSIADMSRGAIRLHSGPALQPVALAPRVVVSPSEERGNDRGSSWTCPNQNNNSRNTSGNSRGTGVGSRDSHTVRLHTSSSNGSSGDSGRQRPSDHWASTADRLERRAQYLGDILARQRHLAMYAAEPSGAASDNLREPGQPLSASSRINRAANSLSRRADRLLGVSRQIPDEQAAADDYYDALFEQIVDDYDHYMGEAGALAVRASSSSRGGRSHNAGLH